MFSSNELLNNFKNQVEMLIEQLTKLTYSEQCEGIQYIRNCLENLKISKRKNTGLFYSVHRKSESGKADSKSKKTNSRRNKKVSSVSSNNSSINAIHNSSVQDDNEKRMTPKIIHDESFNTNFEEDSPENDVDSAVGVNLNNKIHIARSNTDTINLETSNDGHTEEFDLNYDLNKDNVSNESVENKRTSLECCDDSIQKIQNCERKTKCSNSKRKFLCIICECDLPNMADLIKHILSHDCAPSSCIKCKAIFQNRISYNYHVSIDDCGLSLDVKGVYNPSDFAKQKENDAINKQVLLSCPYCGIKFGKMHTLKRHLKERCVCVTRKYQCTLCDQSFVSEDMYEIHKKKHQKFQCTKCELSFWNRRLLREHRKTHGMVCKKANIYTCQQCKNTFKGRTLYREHREVCKQSDSFPDPVWCKECVMMFRDRYTYKRHCIRKNHVITDQDTTVKKPFVCEKCGTAFASSYGLSTHCSRMHQQKAAVFSCDQCSYTTMRMTNLSRHKNCRHGGQIRKYVCDKCPALLSTSTSLRYHYETFHCEAKNFPCDICSKSFKLKTQLNRHKLIHSAVMPYNCLHCPKGFLRASLLQRHVHSKHDEHIPKDQLAISVMKFNKNSRKKPSSTSKPMESPLDVNPEVPAVQPPKDQVFSLIDVQSGELVTLSVTEMSNSAVINMSDGDLLNGIHIPDLWTNPAGLFSLDPMMQDAEASAYGMLTDGGPHVSQDLLKTLHGQLGKETMSDYMPQYLEIDGSHKDMTDGCLLTQDYTIKPNMLSQTILTSDNMIISMPNTQ